MANSDLIERLLAGSGISEQEIANEQFPTPMQVPEVPMGAEQIQSDAPSDEIVQDDVSIDPVDSAQSVAPAIASIPQAPKDIPTSDTPATELSMLDKLRAIQGDQNALRRKAALAGMFQTIAQTGAIQANPNYKVDTSAEKMLNEQADRQSSDLMDQAKLQKISQDMESGDLKLQDQKKLSDPKSTVSVMARKQMQSYFDKKGMGMQVPEETTALDAKNIFEIHKAGGNDDDIKRATLALREKRLDLQEQGLDLRKSKEGRLTKKDEFRVQQKGQDDLRNMVKDMRATDVWKSASKSLGEIDTIDKLLDDAYEKGGQSLAMLGPKVAKGIAGEVGVLTEADVTRYVQNPSLVGGMMDTLAKLKSGKITETSYDNLKRLLDISKKTAQNKIDTAKTSEAALFSKREGIPFDDAMFMIDETVQKEAPAEEIKSDKVKIQLPDGRVGSIPRSKLKAALEKGAKEI